MELFLEYHASVQKFEENFILNEMLAFQALGWLKSYYWEPQKNAIPNEGDLVANLRKEIKQRLRELSFCLKAKQMSRKGSLLVKGKRESESFLC